MTTKVLNGNGKFAQVGKDTKTLRFTRPNYHYWDNKGYWNPLMEKLNKAIPATGSAATVNVELVRAVNRLYWDYCNNGNGNAREMMYGRNEWGDEDEDEFLGCQWNDFYYKFYDLIETTFKHVRKDLDTDDAIQIAMALDQVNYLVTTPEDEITDEFSDTNMNAYDVLVDFVCWYVTNYSDHKLMPWYDRD